MRKRKLPDKSVAGFITPAKGENVAQALSLLQAAPFLIVERDKLIWPELKLAKKLLRLRKNQLPSGTVFWSKFIDEAGGRQRKKALQSLTWDGAQYAVQYQLITGDAHQIWVEERGDDELTGLWNKSRLAEGLEQFISLARRCRTQAIFLRLKLSNLEQINKIYGYDTGDFLLKSVADRLSEMACRAFNGEALRYPYLYPPWRSLYRTYHECDYACRKCRNCF